LVLDQTQEDVTNNQANLLELKLIANQYFSENKQNKKGLLENSQEIVQNKIESVDSPLFENDNIDETRKKQLFCPYNLFKASKRGQKPLFEKNPDILIYVKDFIEANIEPEAEVRRRNSVQYCRGFTSKELRDYTVRSISH